MPITGTFDDREQIRELYARYAFTIDHGPYEDWVKCFTSNGIFESPRLGRHEGEDALRKFTACTSSQSSAVVSSRVARGNQPTLFTRPSKWP